MLCLLGNKVANWWATTFVFSGCQIVKLVGHQGCVYWELGGKLVGHHFCVYLVARQKTDGPPLLCLLGIKAANWWATTFVFMG